MNALKELGNMRNDTFTEEELAAASKRLGYSHFHTAQIIVDIRLHREPEYPPGTVVKDDNGTWWKRTHPGVWIMFGNNGIFSDDAPKRPLTVKS